MIYYILTAIASMIVTFIATIRIDILLLKMTVENYSENNKPMEIRGKHYFFMTQDQIQNAVKAIIGLEQEYNKPQSEMEIN